MRIVAVLPLLLLSCWNVRCQVISGDDTLNAKASIENAPYIDFSSPDSARQAENITPDEQKRSSRYDHPTMPPIYNSKHPEQSESITTFTIRHRTDDPLPVHFSDIIAIGTVNSETPHLTKSGSNVYTTFSFTVDTVLKAANSSVGSVLMLERVGGVVLYPSGRKRFIGDNGVGLPVPNHKYILFLKSIGTSGSYQIIDGYALEDNHVIALDQRGKELESLGITTLIDRAKSLISTQ